MAGTPGSLRHRALSLTERISQALRISGASATETQSALLQFGQALASGVLRGEEFNSVVENSPRLAKALADGLNVPIGRLRKLAEEGRLTADVVVNALMSQKDKLASTRSPGCYPRDPATRVHAAPVSDRGPAEPENGGHRRAAKLGGQRARAPVRGPFGRRLRGQAHDFGRIDTGLAPAARQVRPNRRHAACGQSTPPAHYLPATDVQPPRNLMIAHTIGCEQHDARTPDTARLQRLRSHPTLQLGSLLIGQTDWLALIHHALHAPQISAEYDDRNSR